MKYKIDTKSGKTYKAKDVEVAFGFVTMKFWHGELRLPSSEILSIKKTYLGSERSLQEGNPEATSGGLAIPVFLFILVFLFSLPILLLFGN